MKEIESENLYYRDKFLEENDLNLDCAVIFAPTMIDDLLSEYGGECEFFEQYYCCYGMDQSCWTEVNTEGNWGLTQNKIIAHLNGYITEMGNEITGSGRVFLKSTVTSAYLFIFSRDLDGQRDIIVHFGSI